MLKPEGFNKHFFKSHTLKQIAMANIFELIDNMRRDLLEKTENLTVEQLNTIPYGFNNNYIVAAKRTPIGGFLGSLLLFL